MVGNDTPIIDLVFPISLIKINDQNLGELEAFLGTGFLVGSQGYALTAAHVVDVNIPSGCILAGMFVDKAINQWKIFPINLVDTHPAEDVALLKFNGDHWKETTIRVSFEMQFSSFEYKLFGYPNANLYEDVDITDNLGRVLGRPDLIYSLGHIRRRVSYSLPGIKGNCFYELSQPVGAGCSGSPIFKSINGIWEVVGIYIADKSVSIPFGAYNKDLEWEIQTIDLPGVLAYAVRMDDLKDWKPKTLNNTLDLIP